MSRAMFWLSHHTSDELHRCYRWGGLHVCARCLGVYPVLFVALILQFVVHAPLGSPADLPVAIALTVPATVDWAVGRFRPHAGSNPWRTATGVALGLALGRSLYVHLQRPFPAALVAQILLVTAVAVPVILMAYRRSRRG
jgi:uncharacterized membrane protein